MSRKNNPPGRVRTHKGEWATTGPVGDKLKFVCFTIGSAIKIRYASLSEEESYHHYRRHRRRRAPVGRIFSNETRVVNVVQRRKNSIFVSRHTAHYYFTFFFLFSMERRKDDDDDNLAGKGQSELLAKKHTPFRILCENWLPWVSFGIFPAGRCWAWWGQDLSDCGNWILGSMECLLLNG